MMALGNKTAIGPVLKSKAVIVKIRTCLKPAFFMLRLAWTIAKDLKRGVLDFES